MPEAGIKLHNFKEMQKFFGALDDSLQRRVTRSALQASAKPILNKMKDNLKRHRRTGTLQKSIKAGSAKKGKAGKKEVIVLVGAHKAKNVDFIRDGFYARFLEFGTSKQRPQPWARPAIDSTLSQQRQILAVEYSKRGDKEIKRQARRIIGR